MEITLIVFGLIYVIATTACLVALLMAKIFTDYVPDGRRLALYGCLPIFNLIIILVCVLVWIEYNRKYKC